ncbi:MAG: hypothetical protein KKH52_02435, partial [Nanoarchaeota archaeon]|nr:hypothetical protein [Nanoarchaeota archaeon]
DDKNSVDSEFIKGFKNRKVYIELICSVSSKAGRARIVGVRRKDLDRTNCKTAKRVIDELIERIINGETLSEKVNQLKSMLTEDERREIWADDIFGLLIATDKPEQARRLLYDEIYDDLGNYGYMADNHQAPIEVIKRTGLKVSGKQKSGIDDHYQYGTSNASQVQLKFRRDDCQGTYHSTPGIWELVVKDIISLLVDSMEHVMDYRPKDTRKKISRRGRTNRKIWTDETEIKWNKNDWKEFYQLVELGKMLYQLPPKNENEERTLDSNRRRVLAPHFYFEPPRKI